MIAMWPRACVRQKLKRKHEAYVGLAQSTTYPKRMLFLKLREHLKSISSRKGKAVKSKQCDSMPFWICFVLILNVHFLLLFCWDIACPFPRQQHRSQMNIIFFIGAKEYAFQMAKRITPYCPNCNFWVILESFKVLVRNFIKHKVLERNSGAKATASLAVYSTVTAELWLVYLCETCVTTA